MKEYSVMLIQIKYKVIIVLDAGAPGGGADGIQFK